MPRIADGIHKVFLEPNAGWFDELGATRGARRLQASVIMRCSVTFKDAKSGFHQVRDWTGVAFPPPEVADADAFTVIEFAEGDVSDSAPTGAVFTMSTAPLSTKTYFTGLTSRLKERLVAEETVEILHNSTLKLYGEVDESQSDFIERCASAATEKSRAELDSLQQKFDVKIDRAQQALADAKLRAEQARSQASTSRSQELISGAGSILGAIFGGRRSSGSITGALNRGASGRARTQRSEDRVATAESKVVSAEDQLAALREQLETERDAVADRWSDAAATVESLTIRPTKTNVAVRQTMIAWVPTD